MSYDIDPKNAEKITVGVNTRNRTSFVEVGETIPGTTLRVQSFVPKRAPGPNGVEVDSSEIILVDTTSNKSTVVAIAKPLELLPAPKK